MKNQSCILSTKTLSKSQKDNLLQAGFSVIDTDFIKIDYIPITLKKKPSLLIFTSKNAIKSISSQPDVLQEIQNIPCICVGRKTTELAKKYGFEVLITEDYSQKLSEHLPKYKGHKIAFFCGNLRQHTLPETLKNIGIEFDEYQTYTTLFNSKKIEEDYDSILFFSPSGIKSFLQQNTLNHKKCFCIGTTTANALKPYSNSIFIAHQPTIDSTIEQCIKQMNPNY